jgi:hypothetical protein
LVYHLSAGTHTLTVKQREDGARLDKILVTNDLSMTAADLETTPSGGEENIWIEAEDGDIYAPMEIADDAAASAGGYVWAPEGDGNLYTSSKDGGRVEYRFDVPTDGDYAIWGRVMAPDSASDSFYVRVDGSEMTWHTRLSDNGNWTWDVVSQRNVNDDRNASNPLVYHLRAGTHTLTIKQREDGARLDKILVTRNLGLTAADLGPTTSGGKTPSAVQKDIWIEAEGGDIVAPMATARDAAASAGRYIWTPEGTGNLYTSSKNGGQVEYRFNVPTGGDYVIWGRVMAPDSGSDSFYVRVDGSEMTWHTRLSDNGNWTWDVVSQRNVNDDRNASNPLVYHLSAGTHTLTVKQREDGARLDKILVTRNLNTTAADLE